MATKPYLLRASMRPPEFTGGNTIIERVRINNKKKASMRPPEFTGGNKSPPRRWAFLRIGFNEAAGIHRRKRTRSNL